jgi:hypothetical protein
MKCGWGIFCHVMLILFSVQKYYNLGVLGGREKHGRADERGGGVHRGCYGRSGGGRLLNGEWLRREKKGAGTCAAGIRVIEGD